MSQDRLESGVPLRFWSISWPHVPTGKAFCAFRLLPVRLLCIRPLLIPKRSASTRSTERLATASNTDTYIEVSKDELENIALESTRTIDIDEFVPKSDIDPRYLIRPYYLVPDGKVGHDAFAVIRETIRNMDTAVRRSLSCALPCRRHPQQNSNHELAFRL